jgi:hypothetical protein
MPLRYGKERRLRITLPSLTLGVPLEWKKNGPVERTPPGLTREEENRSSGDRRRCDHHRRHSAIRRRCCRGEPDCCRAIRRRRRDCCEAARSEDSRAPVAVLRIRAARAASIRVIEARSNSVAFAALANNCD